MIKTEALTKKFGDFTALTEVSCSIPKGSIYGMVGSNGAGKSTFLRLVNGVYRPDSGTITIDDEPVYENPSIKSRISYVPDTLFFLPDANMKRMAKFYASFYPSFDFKRFNDLTEAFELNPKMKLHAFSKGMKRQAAIILTLSCKPDYMFFDETFDGLDPVMRNLVKSLICKDVLERNVTTIVTSHSLRELEDICDQLALLHKGGLVLQSDIENLKTKQFKVQIAFKEDFDESRFDSISHIHFKKTGSVASMIVKSDRDTTVTQLSSMSPILLDILPLTLEEVFTYEMESLGYNFDKILEEKNETEKAI
ncbi:MAG: ABC transporter ATP-binding protein [Lachnospiraceae bacterium]|nr:ABC transporter ATP-binding protein [Lachnospiraceae bacterium]